MGGVWSASGRVEVAHLTGVVGDCGTQTWVSRWVTDDQSETNREWSRSVKDYSASHHRSQQTIHGPITDLREIHKNTNDSRLLSVL